MGDRLKNKSAIITGGTKGIGYGIAKAFLNEGAKVLICGRSEEAGLQALEQLKSCGPEVLFVKADVRSLENLQLLVDQAVERFGSLDIYCANAGINDPKSTHYLDIDEDSYDRIMDINLKSMFFGGQYAARQMARQGKGGVIINVSSVNAWLALDSQMVYTASKGGVAQLTKVQAVSLAPYGIKVNAMAPGPIETDLMRAVGSDEQLRTTVLSRTPIGRFGTIEECGRLAVFLASEDSDFIFGQSIYNDGGRSFQAFPGPGYKTVTEEEYRFIKQKTSSSLPTRAKSDAQEGLDQ
jgi:glucose 1-dehydrogenase